MNILWKQPSGVLALTSVFSSEINLDKHVQDLVNQGSIPKDWSFVAFNVDWPNLPWKHETFRWNGSSIEADLEQAKIETKERLRQERSSILSELDIKFQRNLENGFDNTDVINEKNRLRDITKAADNCSTLEDLLLLSCKE